MFSLFHNTPVQLAELDKLLNKLIIHVYATHYDVLRPKNCPEDRECYNSEIPSSAKEINDVCKLAEQVFVGYTLQFNITFATDLSKWSVAEIDNLKFFFSMFRDKFVSLTLDAKQLSLLNEQQRHTFLKHFSLFSRLHLRICNNCFYQFDSFGLEKTPTSLPDNYFDSYVPRYNVVMVWSKLRRDESLLQKMRNSISTKKVDRTDYCIEDADELEDDSYRHNSCQLM